MPSILLNIFNFDIMEILRVIFFALDRVLYFFIEKVYNFILQLASFELFSSQQIGDIAAKIYAFLGLVMLFKITFSLISIVASPEESLDKKSKTYQGDIIGKVSLTLGLILLLPLIFTYTSKAQQAILAIELDPDTGQVTSDSQDNNMIAKIFDPIKVDSGEDSVSYDTGFSCFYGLRKIVDGIDNDIVVSENVVASTLNLSLNFTVIANYKNELMFSPADSKLPYQLAYDADSWNTDNLVDNAPVGARVNYDDVPIIGIDNDLDGFSFIAKYNSDGGIGGVYDWAWLMQQQEYSWELPETYKSSRIPSKTSSGCLEYLMPTHMKSHEIAWDYRVFFAFASYREMIPLENDIAFSGTYYYQKIETRSHGVKKVELTPGRRLVAFTMRTFMYSDEQATQELINDGIYESLITKVGPEGGDITRYSFGLSTIVALFVLLMVVITTFDIALRIVKLGILEMIAPIPVMTYITSKNYESSMLKRWVKEFGITYADIFIRLSIVFMGIFVMGMLADNMPFNAIDKVINAEGIVTGTYTTTADGTVVGNPELISLFIIIGVLMFIKQAPTMIGNLLNIEGMGSGQFSLNPMKKIRGIPIVGSATAAGLGAAGGMFSGARSTKGIGNRIKSGLAGGLQGMQAGAKSVPMGGLGEKDKYEGQWALATGSTAALKAATGDANIKGGIGASINRGLSRTISKGYESKYGGSAETRATRQEVKADKAEATQTAAENNYTASQSLTQNARTAVATTGTARSGAEGRRSNAQTAVQSSRNTLDVAKEPLTGAQNRFTSAQAQVSSAVNNKAVGNSELVAAQTRLTAVQATGADDIAVAREQDEVNRLTEQGRNLDAALSVAQTEETAASGDLTNVQNSILTAETELNTKQADKAAAELELQRKQQDEIDAKMDLQFKEQARQETKTELAETEVKYEEEDKKRKVLSGDLKQRKYRNTDRNPNIK